MTFPSNEPITWSVSDFIASFNQTIEFAYQRVVITGELANLRISKNKWLYFDLKDEESTLKFFGTVYALPGPLEDGMLLRVSGAPRLHTQFGFSITVQNIQPVGEGSIKKAAALLETKLRSEGLFDEQRKRPIPYPPNKVGLIASGESAAFHDFVKVLNNRWSGIEIKFIDVQVQGEAAPGQLVLALEQMNIESDIEVVIITRGGGSPEDMAAFNHESVIRAVAASRVPTLVAVGHEIDVSLAELAADKRASTPSNAAELLVPDRKHVLLELADINKSLHGYANKTLKLSIDWLEYNRDQLAACVSRSFNNSNEDITKMRLIIESLNPKSILRRGYALVRDINGKHISDTRQISKDQLISIEFHDGVSRAKVVDSEVQ